MKKSMLPFNNSSYPGSATDTKTWQETPEKSEAAFTRAHKTFGEKQELRRQRIKAGEEFPKLTKRYAVKTPRHQSEDNTPSNT